MSDENDQKRTEETKKDPIEIVVHPAPKQDPKEAKNEIEKDKDKETEKGSEVNEKKGDVQGTSEEPSTHVPLTSLKLCGAPLLSSSFSRHNPATPCY